MPTIVCKCGSKLFWKSIRVGGWWRELVGIDGKVEETDLDQVKYLSSPTTAICAECGKRVAIPKELQ